MTTEQDKVTREWDGMAGEWDDMASGYRDEFVKNILWSEETTGFTATDDDDKKRSSLVVVDFGCATGLLTEAIRNQVSQVIAIDVAPSMIGVLKDKIRAGEWTNVTAYCAIAAHLDDTTKTELEAIKGKVDIVAASSVLSFVPPKDLEATMQFLSGLLKPGTGLLCHSDWPKDDGQHPDGFTTEKALEMYKMGGLDVKTTKTITMKMGSGSAAHEFPVFVGVATKKA